VVVLLDYTTGARHREGIWSTLNGWDVDVRAFAGWGGGARGSGKVEDGPHFRVAKAWRGGNTRPLGRGSPFLRWELAEIGRELRRCGQRRVSYTTDSGVYIGEKHPRIN